MTTRTRLTTSLIAGGAGLAIALSSGIAVAAQDTTDSTSTDLLGELSLNLEEERMARDLYDALGEAHGDLQPFVRIERSEQRHYDSVAGLLELKGGTVPEEETAGTYADDGIQALYDDWLERGLVSPEAAFEVGIELETADIAHLQESIADLDDADADRVLGHLLSASEHHLAAFEAAAAGELNPADRPSRSDVGRRGGPGPQAGEATTGGRQQAADPTGEQPRRGQGMRQGAAARDGSTGSPRGLGRGDCPLNEG